MLNTSSSTLFCFTTFCAISLIYNLPVSLTQNTDIDRIALLQFKSKIYEDPLGVTTSWNETFHFCEWYGVTCGRRHQRVTSLDLHSSKLTGILSPYLGNLSFLRELKLQNNSFGGKIPSQVGRLQRLQLFWLFNNTLEGEIPSNISSCGSLRQLSLIDNRLTGKIPPTLGLLSNLELLALSNNSFTGNVPSTLGNLSSLLVLALPTNNFVGSIPDSLGKLKNLTRLDLFENNFIGEVPLSIFNLSSLSIISLSQNQLEGNLPSELGNTLPQLRWFTVDTNRFTGQIPISISNSSNLELLYLHENMFQGQVPSLEKLTKLYMLALYQNSLGYGKTDLDFVSSLANATNLKIVELDHNHFEGVFPKSVCYLSSVTNLLLNDNSITGEIPNCIKNLSNLRYFAANDNQLSGVIPQDIGKLRSLTSFFLDSNQLSGVIPASIGNLSMLSILTLSNNRFAGQLPSALGNCKSLIGLDLSRNSFNGSIPSELLTLPTLSIILNLSQNHLVGSIPEEVGQLRNLDILDVSDNMLSGQIPNSLGSCVLLEFLYMEKNNFQGTIPDEWQSLSGLLELNISYNNLSGEIPQSLAKIHLRSLDISHNHLEGEIPNGGVFSNATGFLFSKNNRLCGGIPQLKLPHCNFTPNIQKRIPKHHRSTLIIAMLSGFFGVVFLLAIVVFYIFWRRKTEREDTTSADSEKFPNLSFQALLMATNEFSSKNILGSGTFGVVYKGTLETGGSILAIKVFDLQYRGGMKSFMAECEVLRRIRHRNLVKVITACSSVDYQGNDFKALVYEYMVNGSLEDWLHPTKVTSDVEDTDNNNSRSLNLHQRLDIIVDVAFSLDYLHYHCGTPIVHCDLKPSNILLDDNMVAHVSDFGLAKFLLIGDNSSCANQESSSIGVRGTIGYTPPEYGMGNEVSINGDVYSFGILLLEMFTGKRPTDDMFKALSLHEFVEKGLTDDVSKIIDPVLLEDNIDYEEIDSSATFEVIISILEIGISCSSENPRERLNMSDVATKLSLIKSKFHVPPKK